MPSFKTDVSFLEKISIGAIGTKRTFDDLTIGGHTPIELERGSMSYKIWKSIKIKRIRVPDLLCIKCGKRVESRAKTNLEITMSHSVSDPARGWDAGLKNDDYVSLVGCEKIGLEPIDWQPLGPVQYIKVEDLKIAFKNDDVFFIEPKGSQEGFESRLTWPSSIAKASGTISEINDDQIKYKRESDNRTITLSLTKKKDSNTKKLNPLFSVGDNVKVNQIISSVVPVTTNFDCEEIGIEHFINNINSTNLSERYAAAKALSFSRSQDCLQHLKNRIEDEQEHIYVKLEAAASMCKMNISDGYKFLTKSLSSDYLEHVLETVIVLSEINTNESNKLLISVLENSELHPELRAGAAWGLGEQNNKESLSALIHSFNELDELIRIEAARSLGKLSEYFGQKLLDKFIKSSEIERPGIAYAITKLSTISADQLIKNVKDDDSRHWISYILGMQNPEQFISELEKIKENDPEVYFAVTVLWKILNNWVFGLKDY